MSDEEIYNKLRKEYPGASTASLYQMMEEVKKSQSRRTMGSPPEVSEPTEYEFGFTGFRNARDSNQSLQQASNSPQQGLSNTSVSNQSNTLNQAPSITYQALQDAYNQMLNQNIDPYWSGGFYPSYGVRATTMTYQLNPPPPMSPVNAKPAKKQAQAEVVVTGKRSIILDGDI